MVTCFHSHVLDGKTEAYQDGVTFPYQCQLPLIENQQHTSLASFAYYYLSNKILATFKGCANPVLVAKETALSGTDISY